jgi:hypothetical protein
VPSPSRKFPAGELRSSDGHGRRMSVADIAKVKADSPIDFITKSCDFFRFALLLSIRTYHSIGRDLGYCTLLFALFTNITFARREQVEAQHTRQSDLHLRSIPCCIVIRCTDGLSKESSNTSFTACESVISSRTPSIMVAHCFDLYQLCLNKYNSHQSSLMTYRFKL